MLHSYIENRIKKEEEELKKNENSINNIPKYNNSKDISNQDMEIVPFKIKIKKDEKEKFNNYFLSDFVGFSKTYKKIIITIMIIFQLILFIYKTKLWIYFNKKENVLPIATKQKTQYYITAMIANMEPIIKDYIIEMKKLINYLGKENVIISFVENGDSKDNTRKYLEEFRDYLEGNNIRNKFYLKHLVDDKRNKTKDKSERDLKINRIEYFIELRNLCLNYLYEIPNLDFNNTKIINFNDIIFAYEDIIKLLSTNKEDYDATCGLDFYFSFYDDWVSMDLDGNSMQPYFPYFINKEGQDRIINNEPIRIFSCWNGVIIYKAAPLINKKVKFRMSTKYKSNDFLVFNGRNISDFQSECTYFFIDLYTQQYQKIILNPDVRVAYKYIWYYYSKYIGKFTFEILFYFVNYFKGFFHFRNYQMSNLVDQKINLKLLVQIFYRENKNRLI